MMDHSLLPILIPEQAVAKNFAPILRLFISNNDERVTDGGRSLELQSIKKITESPADRTSLKFAPRVQYCCTHFLLFGHISGSPSGGFGNFQNEA